LPCRSPLLIVTSSVLGMHNRTSVAPYFTERAREARQLFVADFASSVSTPDAQALASE
jgi:hypothetical protein